MFLWTPPQAHAFLRDILNQILHSGELPLDWCEILVIMLPEPVHLLNRKNWWPIVILDVAYKISAKLLHARLAPQLEHHQSLEQLGFRDHTEGVTTHS